MIQLIELWKTALIFCWFIRWFCYFIIYFSNIVLWVTYVWPLRLFCLRLLVSRTPSSMWIHFEVSHHGTRNGLFMYSSANFSLVHRLRSLIQSPVCFFSVPHKRENQTLFSLSLCATNPSHLGEFMYLLQSLAMHNSVEWPVHLIESGNVCRPKRDTH